MKENNPWGTGSSAHWDTACVFKLGRLSAVLLSYNEVSSLATRGVKQGVHTMFPSLFFFFNLNCFVLFCLFFLRAIYFAAYSKSKETFNGIFVPNSGAVHMSSAGFAGETLRGAKPQPRLFGLLVIPKVHGLNTRCHHCAKLNLIWSLNAPVFGLFIPWLTLIPLDFRVDKVADFLK